MEDKKILEEFIEAYSIAEEVLDGDIIQSIENLIVRNKELEKHYQHEQEYINGEVFSAKQMHYIEDNYIDKSKVKEKIEELEAMSISKDIYYDDIKILLQELLEES